MNNKNTQSQVGPSATSGLRASKSLGKNLNDSFTLGGKYETLNLMWEDERMRASSTDLQISNNNNNNNKRSSLSSTLKMQIAQQTLGAKEFKQNNKSKFGKQKDSKENLKKQEEKNIYAVNKNNEEQQEWQVFTEDEMLQYVKAIKKCPLHSTEDAKFICIQHDILICDYCFKSNDHSKCNSQLMKTGIVSLKSGMELLEISNNKKIKCIEKNLYYFQNYEVSLKQKEQSFLDEIDTQFNALKQLLDQRKEQLKDQLYECIDRYRRTFGKEIEMAKRKLQVMNKNKIKIEQYKQFLQKGLFKDLIKEYHKYLEIRFSDNMTAEDFTQNQQTFKEETFNPEQNGGPFMFYFESNTQRVSVFDMKQNGWEKTLLVKSIETVPEQSSYIYLPNNVVLQTGGKRMLRNGETSNMINPRYGHCGAYQSGFCFVIGGFNGNMKRPMRECERYSKKQQIWRYIPTLNVRRYLSSCCIINQKFLYVFGGYNSEQLDSIERLNIQDEATDQDQKWEIILVKLPTKMISCGVLQIEEQRVMIFGGYKHKDFYTLHLDSLGNFFQIGQMEQGGSVKDNPIIYGNKAYFIVGMGNTHGIEALDFQKQKLKNYGTPELQKQLLKRQGTLLVQETKRFSMAQQNVKLSNKCIIF